MQVNCALEKRPTIKLSHRFNSVKYLFSVTSTKTRHGDHSSKCYCKNTCLSTCKNVVIINELRYVKRRAKMKQSYACYICIYKISGKIDIDLEIFLRL